jgi:hypothetical protein
LDNSRHPIKSSITSSAPASRSLDLARDGTKAYSEAFDLVHRREASGPNAIWQADHAVEELLYRTRVRHSCVAVADTGGKEFDETAAGTLALGADNRRQRLKRGPDQHRRQDYLVGQQDRLLRMGWSPPRLVSCNVVLRRSRAMF